MYHTQWYKCHKSTEGLVDAVLVYQPYIIPVVFASRETIRRGNTILQSIDVDKMELVVSKILWSDFMIMWILCKSQTLIRNSENVVLHVYMWVSNHSWFNRFSLLRKYGCDLVTTNIILINDIPNKKSYCYILAKWIKKRSNTFVLQQITHTQPL